MKAKTPSHRLLILLLIRSGCRSMPELNRALGKRPGNSTTWYHLDALRRQGLIAWPGNEALTLTAKGRAMLSCYVLLPGNHIGKGEIVGERAGGER